MTNISFKSINIFLYITCLFLTSCSLQKCHVEAKMQIRDNNFSCKNCDYNFHIQEKINIIKSPSIINKIKQELNQNLLYRTYLSDHSFAKKFKVEKIKQADPEIVNLIFVHSDSGFANEVMNTWINLSVERTMRVYSPEIKDREEIYQRFQNIIYSDRTIDTVFNRLNTNSIYPIHLSKQDFKRGFQIDKENNGRTINITYKHSDPDFANQVISTWQDHIFDLTEFNYDISGFSQTFRHSEHFNKKGIKSLSFMIKDKRIIGFKLLELPNFNCNWLLKLKSLIYLVMY